MANNQGGFGQGQPMMSNNFSLTHSQYGGPTPVQMAKDSFMQGTTMNNRIEANEPEVRILEHKQ